MNATATKERPILFSAPMVKALLEGRKTQTRRIVKPSKKFLAQVDDMESSWVDGYSHMSVTQEGFVVMHGEGDYLIECPYGQPGDRLWVRETWTWIPWQKEGTIKVSYGADGAQREVLPYPNWNGRLCKLNEWRPSIFMPRWASRLTLEITDVRVQRVEEISEEDALAEGCGPDFVATAEWAKRHGHGDAPIAEDHRGRFLQLFYDINKRAKRGENPWVWALTFKVIKPQEPTRADK